LVSLPIFCPNGQGNVSTETSISLANHVQYDVQMGKPVIFKISNESISGICTVVQHCHAEKFIIFLVYYSFVMVEL